MSHLSQLAFDANSNQLTDIVTLLFHNDNQRDFQLVRDTYVSCQHLMVRCEERHEQILELQNLVGSTVVAECVRLLQKFQQDDLESSRGMMRLICETQLKVLKKLSFIALLRRQCHVMVVLSFVKYEGMCVPSGY
ncbi:hypothetical protein Tco_0127648 [Tanacetum coccineum]